MKTALIIVVVLTAASPIQATETTDRQSAGVHH